MQPLQLHSDSEPPTPRKPTGIRAFLAELWQRQVVRVCGFYLIGAWFTIQVADTIFPALGFSPRAVTFTVLLALLGLPFALLLAWAFELTPDGRLRLDSRTANADQHDRTTIFLRRVLLPTAALAVLVALAAYAAFRTERRESDQKSAAAPADRIAVLYFDDSSPARDLGYLANGLTESLINELTNAGRLSVVSRNGVAPFRDQRLSADSIARALRVGTLVSGSVMRSGDRVRVTVELIDASTSETIDSRIIERPSGDVFTVIDEVVGEVSRLLRERLRQNIRMRQWRAEVSEPVWTLAQRAAALSADASKVERAGDMAAAVRLIEQADQLYAQAQQLDRAWVQPTIERGWLKQREAMIRLHYRSNGGAPHESLQAAVVLADSALQVGRHAAALELRGVVRHFQSLFAARDSSSKAQFRAAARDDLRRAVELDSTRARAWSTYGLILYQEGRLGEALLANERAYQADAYLSDAVAILYRLFDISFELRQDRQALRWCNELQSREADYFPATLCRLTLMAWSDVLAVSTDSVWPWIRRAEIATPTLIFAENRPKLELAAAAVLARAGSADSARAVISRARRPADPELLYYEAAARLLLNEPVTARRLLNEYAQRRPGVTSIQRSRRFAQLFGGRP